MTKRKHRQHMNSAEVRALKEAIRGLDPTKLYSFNWYIKKRMKQRGISRKDINRTIKEGHIIEAHNEKRDDIRILLRHETKRGLAVCLVVSLKDHCIITVYINESSDNHPTLNWSEYQWNVDLVEEVMRFNAKGSQNLPIIQKGAMQNELLN